ncbi:hypothetical protein TCSYLVIO_009749 [Trypanosoma cruzi]|nr:hypothetical protein TCSYLVIO_009749 [Trypanosoma cruzi]
MGLHCGVFAFSCLFVDSSAYSFFFFIYLFFIVSFYLQQHTYATRERERGALGSWEKRELGAEMLLRVRGTGASPENSQATLMYLRGFRRTNTRPPSGEYLLAGIGRPLLYPHFHVGIQTPGIEKDVELRRQLLYVVWKELWNVYDIAYDELRLFPDPNATAALLSSSGSEGVEDTTGFTRITARSGANMAVVVTHYIVEDGAPVTGHDMYTGGQIVVLDLSDVPLADAATRIAVELAWTAGYASMQGALNHASHVVVRLPYICDMATVGECSPLVQEGLDFMGEHIALLTRSFTQGEADGAAPGVDVSFIGAGAVQLQETLDRLCSSTETPINNDLPDDKQKGSVARKHVLIFAGDQHAQQQQPHITQLLQSIESSIGVSLSFESVPLKGLLEGAEEQWDAATTRENQILNFCPCCGHCGGH